MIDVAAVTRYQLEELAADVGRLRRRVGDDDYAAHLLDRVAGHVEALDLLHAPNAAEVYRANLAFGGGEDESVECALADVDGRVCRLRGLLGEKPR